MSRARLRNPLAYERANYIRIPQGWQPQTDFAGQSA